MAPPTRVTLRTTSLLAVRALVLNATYEPISVVSARRAVVLVLAERAESVHGSGKLMRSERISVEIPSVVRLLRYVNVPYGRRAALSRRAVFIRDGHRCQYCGGPAESIDHVIPRSRGGRHVWENVVACCRTCNAKKRDQLPEQTGMRPLRPPRPPREACWILAQVDSVPREWFAYLEPSRISA
ncbi:MAG: HNH endonuclease [Acidimicrobiales bacterium]|nr:MAG: HNH endonuclease [Acidimicrobiales bacterium]